MFRDRNPRHAVKVNGALAVTDDLVRMAKKPHKKSRRPTRPRQDGISCKTASIERVGDPRHDTRERPENDPWPLRGSNPAAPYTTSQASQSTVLQQIKRSQWIKKI